VPLLPSRIKNPLNPDVLLTPGQVLLPEILAKGMGIGTGDTVVLVANNKDGSVNGMTFVVAGVVESLMGPGGRDGYLHLDDAAGLLRMDTPEISEVAVRVTGFDTLATVADRVNQALAPMTTPKGQPLRIMALFVAEGFCLGHGCAGGCGPGTRGCPAPCVSSNQTILKNEDVMTYFQSALRRAGKWVMPSVLSWMVCAMLILASPVLVSAQETLTGAQILEQVDHNLQPGNLEMYRKIINIEPDGKKKEFVLWFLKHAPGLSCGI
jgi:hypothetical protein